MNQRAGLYLWCSTGLCTCMLEAAGCVLGFSGQKWPCPKTLTCGETLSFSHMFLWMNQLVVQTCSCFHLCIQVGFVGARPRPPTPLLLPAAYLGEHPGILGLHGKRSPFSMPWVQPLGLLPTGHLTQMLMQLHRNWNNYNYFF